MPYVREPDRPAESSRAPAHSLARDLRRAPRPRPRHRALAVRTPALRRPRDDATQSHSAARFRGGLLVRSGSGAARVLPRPAAVAAAAVDDLALSHRVAAARLLV